MKSPCRGQSFKSIDYIFPPDIATVEQAAIRLEFLSVSVNSDDLAKLNTNNIKTLFRIDILENKWYPMNIWTPQIRYY